MLSRKHGLDSDLGGPGEVEPASKKKRLVPAASFADVLADLAKNSEEREESWARPQPPILKDEDSLIFQKLDIRDGQTTSGESEIHLIGVTRGGHSILVHVLDFRHYFYYPALKFTNDDLEPFRKRLNTLVPTSAQWLTNLDIENVAVALNEPPLVFLKFSVSDHRKIQQLRDEYSPINSATPGAESPFSTGVIIWKVSIWGPFYRTTT
jgi:DNA polymerase delta subunit 1